MMHSDKKINKSMESSIQPDISTTLLNKENNSAIQTPNIATSSTGNEKRDKDVFIDIEPAASTSLLVTDKTKPNSAAATADLDVSTSSGATGEPNEDNLPANITRLTTANGSEVFLIGTAHFSPKSAQDVKRVMHIVKPSAVVLELCKERAFMLSLDEESLLEQNRKFSYSKLRGAIAEKGVAQGLIYIMFIKMSANLTEKLGMAPGSEFRAGAAEAHKLPNCRVVLGDRSLRVTIARAVASVSLWQKVKLIYQVLLNDVSITQEEIEKCKDKDILEQLLQELSGEFPGFKRVLLDERNYYLAHSIYRWAENSVTSMGPQRVVAVVGVGHVGGIVEHWGKTTDDHVGLLNEFPKTSKTRRVVTKTIKYCSIALLLYVGYRAIIPTSVQNAISNRLDPS